MEDKNDIMGCLHVLRLSQSELLGCCQTFQLNGKRIKNFNGFLYCTLKQGLLCVGELYKLAWCY